MHVKSTIKVGVLAAVLGVSGWSLTGCNTMEGFGADMRGTGAAIERTAESANWNREELSRYEADYPRETDYEMQRQSQYQLESHYPQQPTELQQPPELQRSTEYDYRTRPGDSYYPNGTR